MNSGDLGTGPTKLHKAWKKLRLRWEATQQQWHDQVSREFAKKYLDALEPQIDATLARMRVLAASLSAAEQECEER